MTKLKMVLLSMLPVLLTSCQTTYNETGDYGGFPHGGYTDSRINGNTAIVNFSANILTRQKDVESYLLYRCAKVTLENGYDYFVVVSTSSSPTNVTVNEEVVNHTETNPPTMHRTYYQSTRIKSYAVSNTNTQQFYQAHSPNSSQEAHGAVSVIKMYQGRPPGMPNAYNANDIIAHIGPALGPSVF